MLFFANYVGNCIFCLFCDEVRYVLSSFATISLKKIELVALLLCYSRWLCLSLFDVYFSWCHGRVCGTRATQI